MPLNMSLWTIDNSQLVEVRKTNLDLEKRLEKWIFHEPSILDLDFVIIGQQVRTDFGGIIDLLGINQEGELVIIELKRGKTPRDIVAQVLDYASWVCKLGTQEIEEICQSTLGKSLGKAYKDVYEDSLPERINVSHQIIIVASELDDSTERIVNYLSNEHDLNVNAIFFNIFELDGKEIIGRSWLKDPEDLKESTSRKRPLWSGYYYVNTGITDDNCRSWEHDRKYGFIGAGGGIRWIKAIRKLKKGDKIFAYIKGKGYVGYGEVIEEAVMIKEYVVEGKLLLDVLTKEIAFHEHKDNPDKSEWLVRVNWLKVVKEEEAKFYKGIFAKPPVACKLRDPDTVQYLVKEFNVNEA